VTPSHRGPTGAADLELPAEVLIRLVDGRLDTVHSPAFDDRDSILDELRRVLPGY